MGPPPPNSLFTYLIQQKFNFFGLTRHVGGVTSHRSVDDFLVLQADFISFLILTCLHFCIQDSEIMLQMCEQVLFCYLGAYNEGKVVIVCASFIHLHH